jgi:hypothetical protein
VLHGSVWEVVGTSNFTTTTGHFFHYIENGFLVDHYIEIDKDHYYENHNVKKNVKRTSKVSVLSNFHILTTYGESTYGVLEKFFFKLSNLT